MPNKTSKINTIMSMSKMLKHNVTMTEKIIEMSMSLITLNKKFELMLIGRAEAYSSSCS